MNMREQFVATTNEFIEKYNNVALILGGISVASFNDNIQKYPNRVFNAGISEQGIVSLASGMAIEGMIPVIHSIAPFIIERAYEQLKLDFGYQNLSGKIVTTGASLDYSSFGATHQCPADIGILKLIPNMQIVVPGTAKEFDDLYRESFFNKSTTYYRLSRDVNSNSNKVEFGKANVIKAGKKATVIAVGPMLDMVMMATEDLDVTVLYYTTLEPFDKTTLLNNCSSSNIVICTPFYEGVLLSDVIKSLDNKKLSIKEVSLPRIFASHYGYTKEHYELYGITVENIRNVTEMFC